MADRYPLVEQREFGPPEQRGGWLNKRTTREQADLPRIAAHQVLVYRVGEEYVEDHGLRGPRDEVVVGASSVSVVDRRVAVPLVVETSVPSAETGAFTLRVTFHCTVTDACAVVRDGVEDAEPLVLGYLREVPGLAEEGKDLPVREAAEVRDRVWSRLCAYGEMVPAKVSGMRIRPVTVEVLTPEEFAAHLRAREEAERTRQQNRFEAELAEERARSEHERQLLERDLLREQRLTEERYRQEQALAEERHRQELEDLRSVFLQRSDVAALDHRLGQETKTNAHGRRETAEDVKVFGYDPLAADYHAFRRGEISADTLSKRLHEAEAAADGRRESEDARQWQRLERQEERAREAARARLERGDRIRELSRQDRREDLASRRQEETRRWEQEQENSRQRRREDREDALVYRQEQREWREKMLTAKYDLTKRVIDRGHGDDAHLDVTSLINDVGESHLAAAQAAYALAEGPGEVHRVERADAGPDTGAPAAEDDDLDLDLDLDLGEAGREEGVG
ncbi:hypothetical protein [Streptomyces venezuelae]|uniref:hypothetical protein n=1 Tax=Streptomyces venezuelae TaxID=54571 RepID=UPI00123A76BA|nr:hypothetical protein [Streptomyces venezuelae]